MHLMNACDSTMINLLHYFFWSILKCLICLPQLLIYQLDVSDSIGIHVVNHLFAVSHHERHCVLLSKKHNYINTHPSLHACQGGKQL